MTEYTFTLKDISPVTHDTYRLIFTRPDDFDFESGQCTHWAFDADGWRDEDRPFTMTSQPEETDKVEFVIKTYPDHEDGVTKEIPKMTPGDKVIGDEPGGAITDKGVGVFIAGGAGVTPYIPILRRRAKDGTLNGCTLIYSNKTERDIILRSEWESMSGLKTVFTVTDEDSAAVETGMIDEGFLKKHLDGLDQRFYLCGPKQMVNDIRDALKRIGVDEDNIVTENGW
ncbi:FAD-binding oxidoreductase [Palleronia abyssalis]|uniref:Anthranilate 1,2-dioxygenase electron transfer component n=1 Tax=Palleronia abyssalis TaxID=1501240 RepID=A0A2R8BSQ2_9RHOB|nr:FAD-binding oxidoreductase [Palleronia abyssalis]SPJ23116.1 Anthranilate 1,2-dioxygenase electron transfer component [Palleronia abyssalis]